jgi:hypothetical protein
LALSGRYAGKSSTRRSARKVKTTYVVIINYFW